MNLPEDTIKGEVNNPLFMPYSPAQTLPVFENLQQVPVIRTIKLKRDRICDTFALNLIVDVLCNIIAVTFTNEKVKVNKVK